jgi:hypothetical protein
VGVSVETLTPRSEIDPHPASPFQGEVKKGAESIDAAVLAHDLEKPALGLDHRKSDVSDSRH